MKQKKTYPYWMPLNITTAGAVGVKNQSFQLGRLNEDYIIQRVFAMWPEVLPAPTIFVIPTMKITFYGVPNPQKMTATIPINVIGTPGMFRPGAGAPLNNQSNRGGKLLEIFVPAMSAINVEIQNFDGPANPGLIQILIQGRRRVRSGWVRV